MYTYEIRRVHRVVDGDTYDLELDLGFYQFGVYRVRLLGVDTPEIYGRNATPEGQAAKEAVEAWFELHSNGDVLVAKTQKADSFGRWLAYITCSCNDDLASHLLYNHFAEPYDR